MNRIILATIIIAGLSPLSHAAFLDVTCNGAFVGGIDSDPGHPDTWTFSAFSCGNSLIRGKFTQVDAGNPSDLLFVGAFIKNVAQGMMVNDSFEVSRDGYRLPDPGPAEAWHELHGSMGGLGSGMASLAVVGTLNGFGTPMAATGVLANDSIFNVSSFNNRAKNIKDPPWTRTATWTWTFDANTPKSGTIHLEAGQGNNFFEAVPEPSTLALFSAGSVVLLLSWGRMRKHLR